MSIFRKPRGIRDKIPAGYLLGRASKGEGPVELIKVEGLSVPGGAGGNSNIPIGPSGGGTAVTVPVTNAELADMAAWTIKARNNAASGDPEDVALGDFTEETTPDDTDFVLGFLGSGELRVYEFSNFPSGASAIYAPLVTGETPGPVLVATEDGQCIMVQIE